ncbi:hypothetical protein EXIGLDRAFT_736604 [Exidia glandulosa HHB12029]|uniref:Uncharacterized protein n=1 Tax=Exidia glandulosa HHB12029 TaxID=1314781 RepID=A0A166ARV3_EXIGL|nr:hypothetical protein EXIGLDRAFT_736604 [Exidia glandulosa HHB12029]
MLFHVRTVLQLCVAALSATAALAIPGRVQRPLSVEGGAVQRAARIVPGLACVQSPCSPTDEPPVADALVEAIVQNVDAELPGLPEVIANLELMRRLDVLKPWLEARVERGSTSVVVHTALAKLYVDESAADQFISTSNFYDTAQVGRYCEERDPYLAVMVYRRAAMDDDFLRMTDAYSMFETQTRYALARRDLNLWARILRHDNPHLKSVIAAAVGLDTSNELDTMTMRTAFLRAGLDESLFGAELSSSFVKL